MYKSIALHIFVRMILRIPNGEVSEWFKEPVLKTGDPARDRGFESHPLRHKISIIINLRNYPSG